MLKSEQNQEDLDYLNAHTGLGEPEVQVGSLIMMMMMMITHNDDDGDDDGAPLMIGSPPLEVLNAQVSKLLISWQAKEV